MKKYAVFDIGSLKVKCVIAESDSIDVNIIHKDSKLTLLGDGLKEGKHEVKESSINKTIDALKEFTKSADKFGVNGIKCVATEGLRKAENVNYVLDKIKKETNLTPEIITQKDEATTLFKAVMKDFQTDQNFLVADVGGGSVQIVIGNEKDINSHFSLPLGTYSLSQKFISERTDDGKASDEELKIAYDYIEKTFNENLDHNTVNLPIIYGSSNVLDLFKFLKFSYEHYESSKNHPVKYDASELIDFLRVIKDMTHKEREEKYPFQWGYMWGIQMAFLIVLALSRKFNSPFILPSNVNIAEGYILEFAKVNTK